MAKRTDIKSALGSLDDIVGLIGKDGSIDKGSPAYKQLTDRIVYHLMDEAAQQVVNGLIAGEHKEMRNVEVTLPQFFTALQDAGMKANPAEEMFSALFDDSESAEWEGMKKRPGYEKWDASKFYDLAMEIKDRTSNTKRHKVAKVLKSILEEVTPKKR